MNRYMRLALAIALLSPWWINGQSLDSLQRAAVAGNPGVRAAYAEVEVALAQVTQAEGLPDPQLSLGYFFSPVETRVGAQRAKVGLVQRFPWFGTLSARGDAAAHAAQAAYRTFDDAVKAVNRDVQLDYYRWLEAREAVDIARANVAIAERTASTARSRVESGTGSVAEVLRAETRLGDAQTEAEIVSHRLSRAEAVLKSRLDWPDTTRLYAPDSLHKVNFQWPTDTAFESHPRVAKWLELQASAESQGVAARRSGLPSFGVGLDYVAVSPRTDMDVDGNGRDIWMPMVTLSIPIFRGQYRAAEEAAQKREEAYALRRREEVNQLRAAWADGKYQWISAELNIRRYADHIRRTESTLRLIMTQYESTGEGFEGLLDVQTTLLQYRLAYIAAIRDYNMKTAELEYLLGNNE